MEEWRDIKGYEGLYQVSNEGRVKSLCKTWISGNGGKRTKDESILKPGGTSRNRKYQQVVLCKDGKCTNKRVHRLVAEAFIPNPDNLPFVNHKDENPENNFVFINEDGSVDCEKSNLEWCDCTYNNNFGTRNERMAEKQKTIGNKIICQLTLDGELINTFISLSEAVRITGLSSGNVSACCNGKRNKCGGFKWQFLKDMNTGVQRMENQ